MSHCLICCKGAAVTQIKVYGLKTHLDACKMQLSDTIHACVVEALHYPGKRLL